VSRNEYERLKAKQAIADLEDRASALRWRLGNMTPKDIGEARQDAADCFAANLAVDIHKLSSDPRTATLHGWCQVLTEAGVQPTRGGKWHPTTVARLLDRLAEMDLVL